jgi:uncharacterized MAPEG superfamily protein
VPFAYTEYFPTFSALVAAAGLVLFQLIIADLSAIRAKHRAGTPIPPDFSRFYFRAARVHANTNESVSVFIALALAGVFFAAAPAWINVLSLAYIACRIAHMLSYYANNKFARSTAFGLSLVVLLAMFIVCVLAAFMRTH